MSKENNLELLCRMAHADSLQEICDLTYQIIGNPVFISDLAHTILSYTKCVEIQDHIWQENVVLAHLQRNNLRQNRQVGTVHLSSSGTQRPVLVEDDYLPFPRVIKTLSHKGRAVGVMVVTAYLCPFECNILDMVDLISSFVVPQMLRERFLVSSDKQSVENFLITLLNGKEYSQAEVEHRLELLNWKLPAYTYLLCLCLKPGEEKNRDFTMRSILEEIRSQNNCRVFLYNSALVCLYGSDTPVERWAEQAPQLSLLMEEAHLQAGVSRRIQRLDRLVSYYEQAQSALELGIWLQRSFTFTSYDTLSSFLIFHRISNPDLDLFVHQKIQALFTYDQEHDTDLCATLQVYLEQAKSLAKTAEILFIHRNTVRYRIHNCTELINSDLEDGNQIFAFILSLRILEYRKKILPRLEPGL